MATDPDERLPAAPAEPATDDSAEFVALLTSAQPQLRAGIAVLMPGESGVLDVLQQTNAKIWEKRDDFQIGTHFLAWAMTIARFELLRYRRHAARDTVVRFSDELELLMIAEVSERSQRDVARRHDALQGCLQQLNEPHRRLLMARYATQKSLTDFAAEFGRSAGSLKVTLHRLRTRLADCIQRRLSTEDA